MFAIKKKPIWLLSVAIILIILMLVPGRVFFSEEKGLNPEGLEAELTVAAASSLRPALEEIAQRYRQKTGVKVVLVFSSSGNLARQIEHGAPFDLFASADSGYLDELIAAGHLLGESREVYARGRIVLSCSRQSGVQVHHLEDLLSEEVDRIALANPSHAPYGAAAREALEKAGIWDAVQEKLVYADTVFQALQFVQSGNAPVGIVAEAVVAMVPEISSTPVDGAFYSPVEHTLAIVKKTSHLEAAGDLAGFIRSAEGRAILESYGFYVPDTQ